MTSQLALKMTSQLVIFRAFFLFSSPTLNLKQIPVNQLIKKIWPYTERYIYQYRYKRVGNFQRCISWADPGFLKTSVEMYKAGGRFADFISFFSNIPCK